MTTIIAISCLQGPIKPEVYGNIINYLSKINMKLEVNFF